VAIIFLAALAFLIIFLDLFDLGICACSKKKQANSKFADGSKKNSKVKLVYLATGGTK
jgi:hypothetical protein